MLWVSSLIAVHIDNDGGYGKNPVFKYLDNQSVLWNMAVPDSTLKNKSSDVAYHFVREVVVNK